MSESQINDLSEQIEYQIIQINDAMDFLTDHSYPETHRRFAYSCLRQYMMRIESIGASKW